MSERDIEARADLHRRAQAVKKARKVSPPVPRAPTPMPTKPAIAKQPARGMFGLGESITTPTPLDTKLPSLKDLKT
jgi:hypothetical protein